VVYLEWTLDFPAKFFWAGGAGGVDLFSFQPIGRPKLGGDREDFFFNFPCFLMCSHDVPFKFLMGSHNVPQVHNVFPNMFSIYKHLTFSPYALAFSLI